METAKTFLRLFSLYSGVRQLSFSSRSTKLSKRRPGKTAKTRYEDYLPWAIRAKALELSGLSTLYHRWEAIAAKLFNEIYANQSHNLHKLLPSKYQPSYSLREHRTFIRSKCKTERCKKNSFLLSYSSWELDIYIYIYIYFFFFLYIGTWRTLLNWDFITVLKS